MYALPAGYVFDEGLWYMQPLPRWYVLGIGGLLRMHALQSRHILRRSDGDMYTMPSGYVFVDRISVVLVLPGWNFVEWDHQRIYLCSLPCGEI